MDRHRPHDAGREPPRARGRAFATLRAEEARQGRIVLRTPLRKAVFIAGLVGAVILAVVLIVIVA